MRILVTGGAGFIGSHLCRRLVHQGHQVTVVDSLLTGRRENLADLPAAAWDFLQADVAQPFDVPGPLDAVLHLASPASPPDYLRFPIETLDVGSAGTRHCLELARRTGARFLLASTSEVYGDPLVHPQPESYWGHVNPVGPRSVYDEAKRFAEALTMAYHRTHGVDTRIARIFNTYGPAMRLRDGRVVPNFIVQALQGQPLTLYGDGSQTRSFCFVDDTVEGLTRLLQSDEHDPVNIGNPSEFTILELAHRVKALTGSPSEIHRLPLPADDPKQRRPDIARALAIFGWEPVVPLEEGLRRTIRWFAETLGRPVASGTGV